MTQAGSQRKLVGAQSRGAGFPESHGYKSRQIKGGAGGAGKIQKPSQSHEGVGTGIEGRERKSQAATGHVPRWRSLAVGPDPADKRRRKGTGITGTIVLTKWKIGETQKGKKEDGVEGS